MDGPSTERTYPSRLAGTLALTGAALMLVGAGIWASTGTDLDRALVTGEMASYLSAAAGSRSALVANLCVWVVGAMALGIGGTAMAGVAPGWTPARDLARMSYWVGVPVAISAFIAWLAVVVQLAGAGGPAEVAIAEVVGWYAYRADNVATALLVGVGPALVSSTGRGGWVPGWLYAWGLVAALAAALSFLPYFVPAAPLGLSFLIVPVGLGWTVAAGVVLLRRKR